MASLESVASMRGTWCGSNAVATWIAWIGISVLLFAPFLPLRSRADDALGSGGAAAAAASSRWELSLDGRVGAPTGFIRVDEGDNRGTRLHLRSDLGIDVSGALEPSVAYHFTDRDAVRGTFLYYFLQGSSTIGQPFSYNGVAFPAGGVHSNLDFFRASVDYERGLWRGASGDSLTGTLGLTYVYLNAKVHGNAEDFYLQELPVPIAGFRFDHPLGRRLGLRASVSGGALPRVDSGRSEGGTVYLQQSHADADLGLTFALTKALQLHAGYHLTYFFQKEQSHEDVNTVELIDNGLRAGLALHF